MRGRTNAGDGVALNATAQNKLLVGQVTAGDFVEYYTEPTVLQQSSTINFKFNIGSYSVGLRGNAVVLFKEDEQISAYSDYTVVDICQYGNFIVFRSSSEIGVLKIQNDQLVLVDEVQSLSGGSMCVMGAGDGKIILLTYTESSYAYTFYKGYVFDISNVGVLSNKTETDISSKGIGSRVNSIGLQYVESEDAFFTFTAITHSYGSLQYNYKIEVDLSNELTLTTANSTKLTTTTVIGRYGRKVLLQASGYVYSYDVVSGNISTFIIKDSSDHDLYSGIIDGDLFIAHNTVNTSIYVRLYRYDAQADSISFINEMSLPVSGTFSGSVERISCVNYTSKYAYVQYGLANSVNNVRLLSISSIDELQEIPDLNKVVPYSTGGHPIGVAKTNGSNGDTIPVYVPTASI